MTATAEGRVACIEGRFTLSQFCENVAFAASWTLTDTALRTRHDEHTIS
jgi:hypothetical protein